MASIADDGDMTWLTNACLSIVVVGASGDLAKKKTYPSLLNLFVDKLLPKDTQIIGYARSDMSDDDLRGRLRPYLEKSKHSEENIENFLKICFYQGGKSYGDADAFGNLKSTMESYEKENDGVKEANRLFYFAIPPNVFGETAVAIKKSCMQVEEKGWTRLIVEKPFGRDLLSFEELNKTLSEHFTEEHLYRIDHYLGKEMVQNLSVLRFSNIWFDRVWNADNVKCVILTFKEPFGTEGRGGYFDKYGIIRDILQNHLLQVLTLMAMEPPTTFVGPNASKGVRDAKVNVLNAIEPIRLGDVVLGQYEGYADDPTIENKETNTPTFAMIRVMINTPRWHGVPFILKAGKALNERKAEMRVQFKDAPGAYYLFKGEHTPRNELVMRMQPNEATYMKTNVKSPGFRSTPIQSELEVNYDKRFFANQKESNPDAYTRLLVDVLRGRHEVFVRDDELRRAWEIFTPVLNLIEEQGIRPIIYKPGTRGPTESDDFIYKVGGYTRNEDYVYYDDKTGQVADGGQDAQPATKTPSMTFREDELCDIGLFGLAVMGQNFALNMAEHGFKVCVGNRSPAKVDVTIQRAKDEGNLPLVGAKSPEELVARLKKPRKIVLLVQAGAPVDETIEKISAYVEPGDVIIDGGNEWFPNSLRRGELLETKGIQFVGMGISGGEEGARHGPSLMPGCSKKAYDLLEPIFSKCAAQVEGSGPCFGYLGPVGSGNYVKMIHNGIEYGDMQLIAEVYDVMKNVLDMSNNEMADIFEEWNKSELESYLIEITSSILRRKDDVTGAGNAVDYILDKTGQKGTGKWSVQEALEKGACAPTIAAALDMRILSGAKDERERAAKVFPEPEVGKDLDKKQVIEDLKAALYASKLCSYAQGLSVIKSASSEYSWGVDLSECARVWKGGCIIRAKVLDQIQSAFSKDPKPENLLVDEFLSKEIQARGTAWRRAVGLCITNGIACPSLSGSLGYFDAYRRARLPANLTQAQRDFFGGHTFERTDQTGRFHLAWTDAHKDIGDANQRIAGENVQTASRAP